MDGQWVRRSDLAPSNTARRSRRGCVSGRRRGSFRAETVQGKPLELHACALWIRSRFRDGYLSYVWSTVSLANCQGSRCLGSVRRRRCAISRGPSRERAPRSCQGENILSRLVTRVRRFAAARHLVSSHGPCRWGSSGCEGTTTSRFQWRTEWLRPTRPPRI
jgi:hypothetical protein